MCGICGFIDYSGDAFVSEGLIRRMSEELKHRGPDDEGVYINNRDKPSLGLGHRRLSIIDLSQAGHQPMSNEDGSVWLIFNGEAYNYKELRIELESKGHIFKTSTDTEALIHLYEEYGQDCVKFLRGMFAFAIWDARNKALLLARDRVGKKPLLYYHQGNKFCFASEFCALLASGLIDNEIDLKAIDYYLTFGYIPAPLTIYKNIFKLLPGHTLIIKDNNLTVKKFWELDYSTKLEISEFDSVAEILKLLKEAVKVRLYSDVPLGVFLSGGIDSSAVVALMSQLSSNRVKTFSVGFQEQDYSELKYARNIAARFGTDHHEFIVKPKALEVLPLLVERYGEPYADSSCIPTYYVAKETKQYVTVALNGDGGDESFAGYERYQAMLVANMYQRIPLAARNIINTLLKALPDSINPKNRLRRIKRFINGANLSIPERYIKWVGIFDKNLKKDLYTYSFAKCLTDMDSTKFMGTFFDNTDTFNFLDILLRTDVHTYLPNDLLVKVDITSMANSLEARSPFLDQNLMEFAARLPTKYKMKNLIKKYLLKKAVKNLVPFDNIYRRKMGFGVPIGNWFRSDLKGLLCGTLLSRKSLQRGYFNPEFIKRIVYLHIGKRKDYSFQLWSLLMLELWHQRFID